MTFRKINTILFVSVFFLLGSFTTGYTFDEIKLLPGFIPTDQRYNYPYSILKEALEATIEPTGPFKIIIASHAMARDRALLELMKGDVINVHVAATRNEWEEKTIPIRIPVLKGLLGYRLLLVNKQDIEKFKKLNNIGNLRQLKAGSGSQWTTTMVLKKTGFNVVTGNNYEGLFGMLNRHRFDYFPRGVNEIFHEFDSRTEKYPNIVIEPTKALYLPTPSYFFISPKYPKLANRIRKGLEKIIQNGVLDRLFQEKYGDSITRAKLQNREILRLDNPFLSAETPLGRSELWFSP